MTTSPPKPRSALAALPVYKPGRSAEVAMAEHDLDAAVKLASNENPFSPLPSVLAAIDRSAAATLNRYADHRAADLRAALADRLGLGVDQVGIGCGSVGLLQQILLAYADPGDEVLYGWRSFEAYPIYTTIAAATQVAVPNRFEALDMRAITAAVTERTRVVFVTSPNNPTGTVVHHDDLATLLDAAPPGCLVVLDEAYYEYVTGRHAPDALSLLADHPNLAVLRTFSKAYGLAALRVGYVLGHPDVVGAIDQVLVPFAVNGIGQAAALASLEADDELAVRVADVVTERERMAAELRRRIGLSVPDPQANFVWLPAGEQAAPLTIALERAGLVTRPFPGEGVRITIGTPGDDDRVLDAIEQLAGPLGLAEAWGLPVDERARTVQDVVERIDAVDDRVAAHGAVAHEGSTDVWAQLAETGGFWRGELQAVVDAGDGPPVTIGRPPSDPARREAIEAGRRRAVADNVAVTRRSLDALRAYVAGLSEADWTRTARHGSEGDMTILAQLDTFHLGDVEHHLAQLDGLVS